MGGYAPGKQLALLKRPTINEGPSGDVNASQHCDDADAEKTTEEGEVEEEQAPQIKKTTKRGSRGRPGYQRDRTVFHRDWRVYEEAESNHVVSHSFSLIEQMEMRSALPMVDDSAWTLWDDVTPRAALDRDGIPVLYHFPIFLLEVDVAQFTKSCLTAVEEIPLTFEATRDGDGLKDESCYIFADGEVSGQVQFAHAVAHENQSPFTSPSLTDGFVPLTAFMAETEFLSQRVNNLLSLVDPTFYEGLERLRKVINQFPNVRAFTAVDPILMEGRSIAFNQKTPLHANIGDFEPGWTVLVSLGSFSEGGYVRIPRLGLRVRFLPGDVLVLRGAFLEYEVGVWSGGRRICLEHFTRDSLWKYAKVEL